MKVFLGGTCGNSTWRDELIPKLMIDYFNPIVSDWTPDCQEEELHQRVECDYVLYVITPSMEGVYSIAEVVDDSNKRPEKTIFCVLESEYNYELQCNVDFTKGQMKSLRAVEDMVRKNGAYVALDLKDGAYFLNAQQQMLPINDKYNGK
jgi:hypothetical protein